jgi:hypothetical protein
MWEDPIVADVHRTREKLAAEYDFDIKAIFEDLRKRQASLGGRLVLQKKRAEPTTEVDRGSSFDSSKVTPSEAAPATLALAGFFRRRERPDASRT